MAQFEKAFDGSSPVQGGYFGASDVDEAEVYRGISRRFHPSWGGWQIIDALKLAASSRDEFHRSLQQNQKLRAHVRDFFKQMYWDRFWGDGIPSQEIAAELFLRSVEIGVHGAVGLLQEGLNLLCASQHNYRPILEDGIFGPKTRNALQAYLKMDDASYLLKVMSVLQGMQHIEKMRENPAQQEHVKGWFKRVRISLESMGDRPAPPTHLRVE